MGRHRFSRGRIACCQRAVSVVKRPFSVEAVPSVSRLNKTTTKAPTSVGDHSKKLKGAEGGRPGLPRRDRERTRSHAYSLGTDADGRTTESAAGL